MDVRLEDAIASFVAAFSTSKSITHPYIATELGDGCWRMADAERLGAGKYRSEEWVAPADLAVDVLARARATARGRFAISVILPEGERDEQLRAVMKDLGHPLMTTEAMMLRPLSGPRTTIHRPPATAVRVSRVTKQGQIDALTAAARRRQLLPEWLTGDPATMRQYVAHAEDDDRPIGWVASYLTPGAGGLASVHNLYVNKGFRRGGIGTALMTRLLRDDRAAGVTASTLLASHTGAHLYPRLGYRQIATLYLFGGSPRSGKGAA